LFTLHFFHSFQHFRTMLSLIIGGPSRFDFKLTRKWTTNQQTLALAFVISYLITLFTFGHVMKNWFAFSLQVIFIIKKNQKFNVSYGHILAYGHTHRIRIVRVLTGSARNCTVIYIGPNAFILKSHIRAIFIRLLFSEAKLLLPVMLHMICFQSTHIFKHSIFKKFWVIICRRMLRSISVRVTDVSMQCVWAPLINCGWKQQAGVKRSLSCLKMK
jgi:hypothetical protein